MTACWSRSVGRKRSTSPPTASSGSVTSHGADANAVLSGGSLTNEKAYLMGKFARLALGTRHIDYNGRFCMVSAGSANLKAFGMDRAMTPLDELVDADVIVVVGANLSDAYPVMLPTTINKARQRGARVVADRSPIRPLGAGRRSADRDPARHRRGAVRRPARARSSGRVCSTSISSTRRTVGSSSCDRGGPAVATRARRGRHRRTRRDGARTRPADRFGRIAA